LLGRSSGALLLYKISRWADLSLISPFLTYLLNGEADKVDAKESIELENRLILEFFNATLKGEGKFTSEGIYEQ
jgi:hypothetical protein